MVTVYLPGGQGVQIPRAVRGELERLPGAGQAYNGFVFKDADGKVVAIFRLDQVAGWALDPQS